MVQIKNIIGIWYTLFIVLCLSFMINEIGYAQSSENYQILKSAFSQGGGRTESANYKSVHAIGQPVVGNAASENYLGYIGFIDGAHSGQVNVDDAETELLPDQFRLLQNYPNPFNPETKIEFHLPEPGDATLAIYNLEGKRIRTYSLGNRSAGVHALHWDGRSESGHVVASGTYLYAMRVKTNKENYHFVKKMIFLK